MAQSAKAAGFELMILTLQKHDKFGKVWVLLGTLRDPAIEGLTYYEDTHTVVDELKAAPEGSRICAVHVKTPEFAHENSQFADRVVSQSEYQQEVLEP